MTKNKYQLVAGGHVFGNALLMQGTFLCSDDDLIAIYGEKFKLVGPCDESCTEKGCEVSDVPAPETKKKAPKG